MFVLVEENEITDLVWLIDLQGCLTPEPQWLLINGSELLRSHKVYAASWL